MGLLGILLGLCLLMWLAYRGWSVLLVGPLAAVVAAAFSGEPLLAHWTLTFMNRHSPDGRRFRRLRTDGGHRPPLSAAILPIRAVPTPL